VDIKRPIRAIINMRNIHEIILEISRKHRLALLEEKRAAITKHYAKKFNGVEVLFSADWITIGSYTLAGIKLDSYHNWKGGTFSAIVPVEYLAYFREILNEFWDNTDHPYRWRIGAGMFIMYFRQFMDQLINNDDYLNRMMEIDDSFPAERNNHKRSGFRAWLIGDSYTKGGNLRYYRGFCEKRQILS
jgi:hypothetical protein